MIKNSATQKICFQNGTICKRLIHECKLCETFGILYLAFNTLQHPFKYLFSYRMQKLFFSLSLPFWNISLQVLSICTCYRPQLSDSKEILHHFLI